MKICYLFSKFPTLTETFAQREIKELINQNIDVIVFSLKKSKKKEFISKGYEELSDRVYYPNLIKTAYCNLSLLSKSSLFYFKLMIKFTFFKNYKIRDIFKLLYVFFVSVYFAQLAKQQNVCHLHSYWANFPANLALIISKLNGIDFSFNSHAYDIYLQDRGAIRQKIREAKFVLTCSEYNRKYLSRILNKRKIFVNYYGIDNNNGTSTSIKKLNNLILSVGRLVESKGFCSLLEACSLLDRKGLDFKCVIIGEGPLRKKLEKMISYLELKHKVFLKGKLKFDKVNEFYNKSTIFVLPSVIAENGSRDGIPNVIIEAAYNKMPIISTNISGIPEFIEDGKNGILIEQKDSQQIARAMELLLKNKKLRETLGKNARKKVIEKFDIKRNVRNLIKILNENICHLKK